VRFYVDGELGGGYALVTDTVTGTRAIAHAFAGARFGYDIIAHRKTFEAELLVRALAVEGGHGFVFGVGMLWGG
jgi:hypothetical protein